MLIQVRCVNFAIPEFLGIRYDDEASCAEQGVLGAATTSFHLGERACTIDLDCSISRVGADALRAAEATANDTVWRNLPVVGWSHKWQNCRRSLGFCQCHSIASSPLR